MASPQTENGYTRIANEIMDELARIRIPGEARQVLDLILRKTYGFNKTEDAISLSQFVSGTGLRKQGIIKALSKLRDMNLVTQKGYAIANMYRFNKDFHTWKPLPKKVTYPKKVTSVTQKGYKRNPKRDIQKTVSKDNITKDNMQTTFAEGSKEILKVFYETINPAIKFENKTFWRDASNLIKRVGLEKAMNAAKYAVSIQATKYAPTITNPTQLLNKYGELQGFYAKNNIKSDVAII